MNKNNIMKEVNIKKYIGSYIYTFMITWEENILDTI